MLVMHGKYLQTVPDAVTMTPEVFKEMLNRFRHHRNVSYGFSKKHTADIVNYRKSVMLNSDESSIPGNLYNMPVVWNTDVTYIK